MFERMWYRVVVVGVLALGVLAPAAGGAPPTKQPTLAVDDVSVAEGDAGRTPAVFTVRLSAASPKAVSVDFATADGSATHATNDYLPASGTLVFAKGQTTKQVAVDVVGDTSVEPDETFLLRLSNAKDAVIADAIGQGTIRNDDTPPPPPTRTLTVTKAGTGTGTVTSSDGGINCGSDCSEGYPDGTTVTLTATPDSGSTFAGWSGACSGTGPCSVTMDSDKTATATFTAPLPPPPRALTVTCTVRPIIPLSESEESCNPETNMARVTSSDGGINCGNDCSEAYLDGTTVTLTATPGPNNVFERWSGDCSTFGFNPTCTLTMDGDKTVAASFLFRL